MKSETETLTLSLVSAVRNYLDSIHHGHRVHLNAFFADWPEAGYATRDIPPHPLPVLSWLAEAVKATGTDIASVANMLAVAANHLAWGQTYSSDDIGAAFLERYGWTELIGQRGPVASKRIACGFLLLGPDIEYPPHRHEAEEIYVPLTGGTLWMRGGEGWVRRSPSSPIYHPAWTPHAMRTAATPLLALYLWRGGDLVQKSRIDWYTTAEIFPQL